MATSWRAVSGKRTGAAKCILVALTGWGQAEDKKRAADAGFDEHMTKPVDPDLLSRVIAFGHSAAA